MIGEILWTPPADLRESTEVGRYLNWLRDERDQEFGCYDALWRWSVTDLESFWASIWEFYGLRAHAPYERVLGARTMPGAEWFPGARLNYAEHMVGADGDEDRVAVIARSQTRAPISSSRSESCASRSHGPGWGCSAWASARATASSPTCRTSPRRSSPSSRRQASALSGRRARRSSARGAWSRGSRRSSRACCSRWAATAIATATSIGGRRWRRSGPGCRRSSTSCSFLTVRPRVPDAIELGHASRRGRAAGVRSGRVRSPAVRAVLLGHDRVAEGDRARPRRSADRAPQEPGDRLGPQARRPAPCGSRPRPG